MNYTMDGCGREPMQVDCGSVTGIAMGGRQQKLLLVEDMQDTTTILMTLNGLHILILGVKLMSYPYTALSSQVQ